MDKKIHILIIAIVLSSTVFGQFIGKDDLSVALFYLQKNELDSAKKYIDFATEQDEFKKESKTWYYRGFVYKELYKKREKQNKTSPFRLTAISSFEKMLGLDAKEEFTKSTHVMLKYVASTLFNDAAKLLNKKEYSTAQSNYKLYRETMLLVNPTADLTKRDVQFKMALASQLNRPKENKTIIDSAQTKQVIEIYLEVLKIDSNNAGANYNLATLYYNEAVETINNMDYDMDIISLNRIQDYCIELFLKSEPYMLKSYEIMYKRTQTLIGLSTIYYGLNENLKSEFYKQELEILEIKDDMVNVVRKISDIEKKGLQESEEYKKLLLERNKLDQDLQKIEKLHNNLEKEK